MTKRWFQVAESDGTPTKEDCPECGAGVIYNGNFFCKFWSPYAVEHNNGDCTWALPHPQSRKIDAQISWRLCGYWEVGETYVNGEPQWNVSYEYPE